MTTALDSTTTTHPFSKRIVYDRETHDFAMYLDGELVGFARTYQEAEVTLDTLVYSRLEYLHADTLDTFDAELDGTGGGEELPPAPLDCTDLATAFRGGFRSAAPQLGALTAAQYDRQVLAYTSYLNLKHNLHLTVTDLLTAWMAGTALF